MLVGGKVATPVAYLEPTLQVFQALRPPTRRRARLAWRASAPLAAHSGVGLGVDVHKCADVYDEVK